MKMLGSLVAASESQMKTVLLDMSLVHVPVSTRLHVAKSLRTAAGSHHSAVESRHTIVGSHAADESPLTDAGSHLIDVATLLTAEERKAGRRDATPIGKTRNEPHGEEIACRLLGLSSGIPLPVMSLLARQKERSTRTMRIPVRGVVWNGHDEKMSERSAGTTSVLGISEIGVSDIAVGSGRESLSFWEMTPRMAAENPAGEKAMLESTCDEAPTLIDSALFGTGTFLGGIDKEPK